MHPLAILQPGSFKAGLHAVLLLVRLLDIYWYIYVLCRNPPYVRKSFFVWKLQPNDS